MRCASSCENRQFKKNLDRHFLPVEQGGDEVRRNNALLRFYFPSIGDPELLSDEVWAERVGDLWFVLEITGQIKVEYIRGANGVIKDKKIKFNIGTKGGI